MWRAKSNQIGVSGVAEMFPIPNIACLEPSAISLAEKVPRDFVVVFIGNVGVADAGQRFAPRQRCTLSGAVPLLLTSRREAVELGLGTPSDRSATQCMSTQ